MEKRVLKTLEYDKILVMLKERASCCISRELVDTMEPSGDFDTVERELKLTAEAETLFYKTGRSPVDDFPDMRHCLERMHAALASCLELPAGSRPLLVSHGIALGCLVSTILGLPAYAERRLRLRNCSISRVDYQQSPWLASGWVVETAGDVSHLDAPAMDELQR